MDDSRPWSSMVRGRTVGFARTWLPVGLWMLVIFLLSSRSDAHGGVSGIVIPKLAHVLEYAVLGFLLARATGNEADALRGRTTLMVIIAVALYAVSDEVHQAFVPGREARLTDVTLDVIGGLIGVVAWRRLARPRRDRT